MKRHRQHLVSGLARRGEMSSVLLKTAILTLVWANGPTIEVPSTSMAACQAAVRAVDAGRWNPLGRNRPAYASCRPGDAFAPGWQCIKGSNPRICG
jgi:hypothetical protein